MSQVYLQSPVLTVYQPAPRQSWHRGKGFSLDDLPERYKPYLSVKPSREISRRTDFDPYKTEYLGTSNTPRSWRKNPLPMPSPSDTKGAPAPTGGSQAPPPSQNAPAQQNSQKASGAPAPAPAPAQNGPAPKTDSKAATQQPQSTTQQPKTTTQQPQSNQNGVSGQSSQKGADPNAGQQPQTQRSPPAAEDKHPSNRSNERFTPERKGDPSSRQTPPRNRGGGDTGRKPGLLATRNAQQPRGGLVTPRYGAATTPRQAETGTKSQNQRLLYDYQGRRITDEPLDEEPDGSPRNKPNVGRERIETQLRSNRIPETKVRRLAARISYLNDEDGAQETQAERLERVLRHTVHNGLDPIVHGAPRKTNMDYYNHDPEGMARKINEMAHDIQAELLTCCELAGVREADLEAGKPLGALLRDGIRDAQTEVEILQERMDKVQQEKTAMERRDTQRANELEVVREEKFQQDKEVKKLRDDYMTLVAEIERSREEEDKLRKQVAELERVNARLQQKAYNLEERTVNLEPELEKLHDENARLYADNIHLVHETRKMQGPDMNLYHQMKASELEVRELKTQCRRTEAEKGQLKGALSKLEANYDLLQREKRGLILERNRLLKENQQLKSDNRRLVLEK